MRLETGRSGFFVLHLQRVRAVLSPPSWFICSALLLTCPGSSSLPPGFKEAWPKVGPQGPCTLRKQEPHAPDSPAVELKRQDESPRSLPTPGKLGLCPSHRHQHPSSPCTCLHPSGRVWNLLAILPRLRNHTEKMGGTLTLQDLHGPWLIPASLLAQPLVGSRTGER